MSATRHKPSGAVGSRFCPSSALNFRLGDFGDADPTPCSAVHAGQNKREPTYHAAGALMFRSNHREQASIDTLEATFLDHFRPLVYFAFKKGGKLLGCTGNRDGSLL